MICINTSHVVPGEPYELEGDEPCSLLDLKSTDEWPLEPASPVHYRFSAVMAGQDLVVTGKAWFMLRTACARCSAPVEQKIQADKICIVYERVGERVVNLDENVREDLLLAMPDYFYCKPDCQGVCFHCGANLNTQKCTCDKTKKQPEKPQKSPWDALDVLSSEPARKKKPSGKKA